MQSQATESWSRWKFTVSVHSSQWIGFNFIPGSNFIFLCFKLITIHYNAQIQKKVKFEPRIKLNHDIGATTKPNRNKKFCPRIEECSSHLNINEKKILSVAQHGELHYPWKKIYTKKENGGI